MSEERWFPLWVVPVAALAVVVAALVWIRLGSQSEPGSSSAAAGAPERQEPTPAEIAASEPPLAPGEMPPTSARTMAIRPGETLELDRASLPRGAPVSLGLLLPFEVEPEKALAMRVIAEDRRLFEGSGRASPRMRGRIEIDIESAFLEPGRYVIELKTPERSHFPLRRYVLQITESS